MGDRLGNSGHFSVLFLLSRFSPLNQSFSAKALKARAKKKERRVELVKKQEDMR